MAIEPGQLIVTEAPMGIAANSGTRKPGALGLSGTRPVGTHEAEVVDADTGVVEVAGKEAYVAEVVDARPPMLLLPLALHQQSTLPLQLVQ